MRRPFMLPLMAAGIAAAGIVAAPATVLAVEEQAPAFRVEDLAGKSHSLAEMRGRVVVISYWATWCAPCRAELAELDRLYRARGGDGLAVIAVTDERSVAAARIRRFAEPYAFPVAIGMAEGGDRYGAVGGALPSTYLLDRTGTMRLRRAGALPPGELTRLVSSLLAEEAPARGRKRAG